MDEYTLTLTADELRLIESALCREKARFVEEARHFLAIAQSLAESGDASGARAALNRSGRMRATGQISDSLLAKLDRLSD